MAAQWPPRSPHDVLMASPSGREKLRRMADRTSPSPSPSRLRTSRSHSALLTSRVGGGGVMDDQLFDGDPMDEDEDEETLQLKLQAIQARLKLKKLQAAKAQQRKTTATPIPEENGTPTAARTAGMSFQSRLAQVRERTERPPAQASEIQVPASPVKKSQSIPNLQASPQRVLMGIDKGRKATEMSLKRPSLKKPSEDRPSSQLQNGGFLRRTNSAMGQVQQQETAARPLSFNERLASARTEETTRQEQQRRVQKARTTAFSVGQQEMEEYKAKAQELPDLPSKPEELSRDQLMSGLGRPLSGGHLQRSRTAPDIPSATSSFTASTAVDNNTSEAAFEAYSGLHLSKRILPHQVLARAVTGKKTYVLKDLLKHVKAPDWSLPDIESDIVVFAIISGKSEPRAHRPGPSTNGKAQQDRGKYMVITLVDLNYEVELFLFNSGFDRFYKLTPGTVLAILNPGILPPPPGREATGRFGLVINSDEDTILEVGKARDLGYCKSVKKDGNLCNGWVNIRRTEYCEFHTNEAVRKARGSRMELNNSSGWGGGKTSRNSKEVWLAEKQAKEKGEKAATGYDRFTGSRYFVSSGHRAVDMDDEREAGMVDRVERQDALKRRLTAKEKEREIARQLGNLGGGAGRDYMSRSAAAAAPPGVRPRASTTTGLSSSMSSSFTAGSNPPSSSLNASFSTVATSFGSEGLPSQHQRRYDAAALGLTGRRGTDAPKVELGPVKRKRPPSASSSTQSSQSFQSTTQQQQEPKAALGWGSVLTKKLGRMKEGERLDGRKMDVDVLMAESTTTATATGAKRDKSPVRKKTRFVTEKGIREAGRESLGEPLTTGAGTQHQVVLDDDDDDDDLIIVK
ncbi:hypothetical protein QBC35DRAFT_377187 [Podospora australis]|uniref:Zinc finger Mcm10/DnaG-type domain-containing protein n=1 Tax=Podospora australis TaxID=1536484 RepID=A0AAN7AL71_9PEZI|nr:hypothetical protein QBC35DRAFT_377187 [Podospora australis]